MFHILCLNKSPRFFSCKRKINAKPQITKMTVKKILRVLDGIHSSINEKKNSILFLKKFVNIIATPNTTIMNI